MLTENEQRFKAIIDKHLMYLSPFFNYSTKTCNLDRLSRFIQTASNGEAIMAKFAANVWCAENVLNFDFVRDVRSLDDQNLSVIRTWLDDPFGV